MGKGSRISGIFKENPNFPTKNVSFKVFFIANAAKNIAV